jgi:hypothetical protein
MQTSLSVHVKTYGLPGLCPHQLCQVYRYIVLRKSCSQTKKCIYFLASESTSFAINYVNFAPYNARTGIKNVTIFPGVRSPHPLCGRGTPPSAPLPPPARPTAVHCRAATDRPSAKHSGPSGQCLKRHCGVVSSRQ